VLFCRNVLYTGFIADPDRHMQAALREARVLVVKEWHKRMLPGHFKVGADTKYGYKPRSQKYLKRKSRRRRGRENLPLVWTGLTREQTRRYVSIRSGPKRTTGTMQAPSYIKIRPYRSSNPALAIEITATTSQEVDQLAELMRVETEKALNRIKDRKVVAIHA